MSSKKRGNDRNSTFYTRQPKEDLRKKLDSRRRSAKSSNQINCSNLSYSTTRGREERHSKETAVKGGRPSQTNNRVNRQSSKTHGRHKNGETFSREELSTSGRLIEQTSSSSRSRQSQSRTARTANDARRKIKGKESSHDEKRNKANKKIPPRSRPTSNKDSKERQRSHPNQNRTSCQKRNKFHNSTNNQSKNDSRKREHSPTTRTNQPNKKPRKQPNPFIRYNDRFSRLLLKDSSEIIIALLNDHAALCDFLKGDNISAKSIEEMMEILSKLYDTPYRQNFTKIFAVFKDPAFLKHLRRYILRLSYCQEDHVKKKAHLEKIIRFFNELLSLFPDTCEDLPLDVLFTHADLWQINNTITNTTTPTTTTSNNNFTPTDNDNSSKKSQDENENDVTQNTNSTNEDQEQQIKDSILKLKSLRDEILQQKHSPTNTTVVKNTPPDDYKSIPVFPRREDIFSDKPPYLRKNIVRGQYNDVTHYLDVQFRLLREDYIAPIRDGVLEVTGMHEDRSRSIRVYRNVNVVGRLLDTKFGGLLHRVQFDASRIPRVNWEHSKRFKYGSLYCLIDSNTTSTMYFVTITDRDPKELKNGILKVKFFDDNVAESITAQQQFFMIESPAYFESYRHVLEGLQNFNKDNLPFQRYLVQCNSYVRPPVYLKKSTNPILSLDEDANLEVTDRTTENVGGNNHGCYDLTEALCKTAESVSVLNPSAWPSPSKVDLNNSQYNALKAALTQEFVVIQGPPGTGKTFVGLRIAKALLKNKSIWRRRKPLTKNEVKNDGRNHSPILVVCYTNHALDQFLEGILEITENVARVGGRGKSESLERFNLKARKKMTKESLHCRVLKSKLKNVQVKIEEKRSIIEAAHKQLSPKDVEKLISDEEREQLQQWERVAHQMRVHRIEAWLKMQDEADDGSPENKRKRSSSDIDDTECNILTPKRLRNTGDSITNLNHDGLSEHVNPSCMQEQGNNKNTMFLCLSAKNAEEKIGELNELEEGELPDSDDEMFHQSNDARTGHTMTNEFEDTARMTDDINNSGSMDIGFNNILCSQANNIDLTMTLVPQIACEENENTENDGINNEDEIMEGKDNEKLGNKHLNDGKDKGIDYSFGMFLSTKNSGEQNDKDENMADNKLVMIMESGKGKQKDSSTFLLANTSGNSNHAKEIVDNGDNIVVIDKQLADERDEEKDNGSSMSLIRRITSKANHKELVLVDNKHNEDDDVLNKKHSNEWNKVDESSRAGNSDKPNDTFTEDAEEGEIFDTIDDMSDSDDTSNDGDGGIDLTTIIEEGINLIRRGNENTKGSVEPNPGVGEEITLSDAQNQSNEQTYQVDLKVLLEDQRSNLYQEWVERYFKHHKEKIESLRKTHDDTLQQISEIESIQVEGILKNVDVIGMTTTGAAKHRLTLQEIKPRIVIVEEAAEVLEGHVITALSSGTDHLILIGDHKQLKPNPAVYELAKHYNLDVSLFERMVNNGFTCHSLSTQHRMRPEIADIMRIIYPKLDDDVSVQRYDSITGIQHNVYFIDHQKPESGNDELKSPSNQHEVDFVTALCRYLLLQGYQGDSITVLTMYTGQLLKLQHRMPKDSFDGIRISSVDNFQGEESDIIILSLVRSNKNGIIGFLNIPNRVCVALSRAKKALYCIGNISMMATKNKLWNKIKNHLHNKSVIGISLPLCCPKHPEKKIEASSAEDFKKAPQGGCMSPCGFRLPCGHACSLHCHPVDPKHEKYRCTEKCLEELCDLKHRCRKLCHFGEDCEPCKEMVSYVVPSCNHEIQIECFQRGKIKCPIPCTNDLPCGHRCAGKCGEDCNSFPCQMEITRILKCGHTVSMPCSTDVQNYECSESCEKLLDCGHKCRGNCSRCHKGNLHVKCEEPCKRLLVCSHECKEPCTKNCPPCEMPCENRCNHSYCPRPCDKPCTPCRELCMWKCEHHECTKRCGEICDREKCNEPCPIPLECGHQCVGVCGDFCPRLCRICDKEELQTIFLGNEDEPDALYIELVDCGHVFEVSDLDHWMELEGKKEDGSIVIQLKVCPKCKTVIRRSLRYGNIIKKTLANIENVKKIKLEEQRQLREKLSQLRQSVHELTKKYPKLVDYRLLLIRVNQMRSDADAYNTLENQLKFFSRLREIDEMFFTGPEMADFVARSSKLPSKKKQIRLFLHHRTLLSNQEVKDISENIAFLSLSCQFEYMIWKIEKDDKNSALSEEIKSSIESAKNIMSRQHIAVDTALEITDEERAVVASVIENVSREVGITHLTPKERDDINKAFNFSQAGHWFKCPNDHIYVITECGGATQTSKCPVCQEVIGGTNHTLVESNQLASEMDGATHAAWSNRANLLNYDPEQLRRLRR
ncbi:NFX1-type zinc finger-containing 1-like [Paramuricea clavata]|uniref:NFX1-type zinc finger-containing 1-like n=1 Tax=Paramuricea clavata TaxID=317549 RepID=A0A7D9DJT5_PARCT|nr:NFX1-type zinc finger-containing 1-like [Paramuricea clavata]